MTHTISNCVCMCEPALVLLRKLYVRGVLTQDDVSKMQKFHHTTHHLQQGKLCYLLQSHNT